MTITIYNTSVGFKIIRNVSVFGLWHLGEQQAESSFAFQSLFAEAVVWAESSGVGIKGVRPIFQDNLESVNALAVIVKIVAEIHGYILIVDDYFQLIYFNSGMGQQQFNKMKSEEAIQYSQINDCIFCPNDGETDPSDLYTMMNQALGAKHASHSNTHLLMPIDIILKLEDPSSRQEAEDYAVYKQFTFIDQDEENLKRWYQGIEFQNKIKMLSEYYKFHKDIPRVIQSTIQKLLGKYFDRKREYDYKCIKRILKNQQGLSITSVQQSMTENSQTLQQKSRYSTMLNALHNQTQQNDQPLLSDSNLLEQICKQIGKALPKTKIAEHDFQGVFFESEKKFENYIKKQQEKHKKLLRPQNQFDRFKKKSRIQLRPSDNYFKLNKKRKEGEEKTTKIQRQGNIKSRKINNKSSNNQNSEDEKKKFVYNTNIRIEIQNAMFYPREKTGNRQIGSESNKNMKSRKSLIGKISTLNDDRYRTPVSKIYQPQEIQSTKYRRRNSSLKKQKQRLRTKESKEGKDHYPDFTKRTISSHGIRKGSQQNRQAPHPPRENANLNFRQRNINSGTVSVGRLKMQNQRYEHGSAVKGKIPMRSGSTDNIRRRSVTIHRQGSTEKAPIVKYSSSQVKDIHRLKGVSINQLLSKKLNIYDR